MNLTTLKDTPPWEWPEGTAEFRNGLVLMKYDGSDPVQLTGPRKGVNDWAFELTRR